MSLIAHTTLLALILVVTFVLITIKVLCKILEVDDKD